MTTPAADPPPHIHDDDGTAEGCPGCFSEPPRPPCDALQFGSAPAVYPDGRCRCLVCHRCGHHTGNATQGHFWAWCKVAQSVRQFHFCCPDGEHGCELEEEEAG